MDIAKAIAKLRINRGMTQDELAAKLFVSRDLVSKWETGARRPDWQTVETLADVFGVKPDEIVRRDELAFEELEKCLPDNCRLTADELTALLDSFWAAYARTRLIYSFKGITFSTGSPK